MSCSRRRRHMHSHNYLPFSQFNSSSRLSGVKNAKWEPSMRTDAQDTRVPEKTDISVFIRYNLPSRILGNVYGILRVIANNTAPRTKLVRSSGSLPFFLAVTLREEDLRTMSGVLFRSAIRRLCSSRIVVLRGEGWLPGRRLVSRVALLQLAQVDRVHVPTGMAFPHVSTRVRDVPGAVDAIRAIESWLLATLEFLMVGETALAAENAAAIRAGELPVRHPRAHVRVVRPHRCRRRWRVRLENVALRSGRYRGEHTVIQPWNTKKTPRSRQSSSYRDTKCPTQRDDNGVGRWDRWSVRAYQTFFSCNLVISEDIFMRREIIDDRTEGNILRDILPLEK